MFENGCGRKGLFSITPAPLLTRPLDFADHRKQNAVANDNDYFDNEIVSMQSPPVEIEIVRGHARNRVRPVTVPVFLIGSAPDCDLVLGDANFPATHTYLFLNEGRVSLRHLGIAPDLLVDGQAVNGAVLQNGQIFQLGSSYVFRVHIHSEQDDSRDGIGKRSPTQEKMPAPTPSSVSASKGNIVRERVQALLAEIRGEMQDRSVVREWRPAAFSIRQLLVYASASPTRASA